MLERICEMLCESKVLYVAESWGIVKSWEILEGVQGKFPKKLQRILLNVI